MNNICPETIVPTMPFLFQSKEHMRKVLDGPVGDEILKALRGAGLRRPRLLRLGLALVLYGEEAGQVARRREGHEDPRAAIRPVGVAAAGDGRERDADALWRGLHGAQDRAWSTAPRTTGRRTTRRATTRSRSSTHDRAFDGAGDAADVEEDLGHADAGRAEDLPRGGEGIGALHAQALGREGEEVLRRGRQGRRRQVDRGRQEVVPGRDEAGLRQVHRRPEAEGHGQAVQEHDK